MKVTGSVLQPAPLCVAGQCVLELLLSLKTCTSDGRKQGLVYRMLSLTTQQYQLRLLISRYCALVGVCALSSSNVWF